MVDSKTHWPLLGHPVMTAWPIDQFFDHFLQILTNFYKIWPDFWPTGHTVMTA
jgi:hypothetical protein